MPTLRDLGSAPVTLASMGQRYRDYPPATFAQRFGPYYMPPDIQQQEQLRQFLEQQMMREQMIRDPSINAPGTRAWPYGNVRI